MTLREKIKITARGYKLIHKLVPGYLPCMFIQSMATAFLPFINIFMSARMITTLAAGKELREVLVLALIMVTLNIVVIGLIMRGMARLSGYYASEFWQMIEEPLNEKVRSMDYEHIENTEIHLKLEKIKMLRMQQGWGLPRLIWSFQNIVQSFFTIIFSVSLIAGAFTTHKAVDAGMWNFIFQPWFALIIIVFIITNVILEMVRISVAAKKQSAVMVGFQQVNRMGMYYLRTLVSDYKAGKDLKLYAMSNIIWEGLNDTIGTLVKNLYGKLYGIMAKYESIGTVMSVTITGVIYSYVAVKALFGSYGIGNIVQYVGSLERFSGGIRGFMAGITDLMINSGYLADYLNFLDMPDVKQHGTLTTEKRADNEYEIEFKNVSFKYPGSEAYALKNLSLKFNIGQRMAVVGMNGSGKTTMIKLLCRLYDPTEGEIMLNGIDIKKYEYSEYLSIFSVVFQDFKLFSFPLGQNVAASVDIDEERVEKCLSMAGLDERLSSMPKGLNTALYKDFEEDGVEISGGEAQKIALARALYKDAPFIVLDEPTAALDPIAEFEVYSKFNEIVGDKTAIYISHRLSSCRFCDDIAVFHEGELIQRGSHDTLIADGGGKYHELWNAQAQYYSDNAVPVNSIT